MRLSDRLRQAEEQGTKAAHRGAELVKGGIHNIEAGLQKLRDQRKRAKTNMPVSAYPDPEQEATSSNPKVRTGIISVNGQDVGKMRCTGR